MSRLILHPLPTMIGKTNAVSAFNNQPALIDGMLQRLIGEAAKVIKRPPFHSPSVGGGVERVHDLQGLNFYSGGHNAAFFTSGSTRIRPRSISLGPVPRRYAWSAVLPSR